jgi:glycosyltransferase involved in cell wall biosynthesis
MKRILYTQNYFGVGGINKITSVKANYFVNHGYEVHVLCTLDKEGVPVEGMWDKRIILHRIEQKRLDSLLRIPLIGRILRFVYARILHLYILFKVNPDIIVSTQQYLEPLTVVLLTFWKKRILEFHGWYNDPEITSASTKDRLMFRFKFPFYKIVALSEREAQKLHQLTGRQVMVIPNPLYSANEKKSDCSSKRALILARFSRQKNLLNFMPFWQQVQTKHPDWTLDIYGSGPQEKKINQLVSSLGLTTIHLHSYTTNPMAELEASSIYLLPSLFEGFPLVVLECMSVGVPCVAFDCPCGPSEIIKDGEDGFVTPFLDYNAFVDKVCYLMEHDDVRKEMGRKAQENIKRFNLDSIMGKWMDLFNSL